MALTILCKQSMFVHYKQRYITAQNTGTMPGNQIVNIFKALNQQCRLQLLHNLVVDLENNIDLGKYYRYDPGAPVRAVVQNRVKAMLLNAPELTFARTSESYD